MKILERSYIFMLDMYAKIKCVHIIRCMEMDKSIIFIAMLFNASNPGIVS